MKKDRSYHIGRIHGAVEIVKMHTGDSVMLAALDLIERAAEALADATAAPAPVSAPAPAAPAPVPAPVDDDARCRAALIAQMQDVIDDRSIFCIADALTVWREMDIMPGAIANLIGTSAPAVGRALNGKISDEFEALFKAIFHLAPAPAPNGQEA